MQKLKFQILKLNTKTLFLKEVDYKKKMSPSIHRWNWNLLYSQQNSIHNPKYSW